MRGWPHGQIRWIAAGAFVLLATQTIGLTAHTPASQVVTPAGVTVSGSIRVRSYSWDWFGDTANGDYTYPATLVRLSLSKSQPTYDWQIEAALPLVLSLPTTAVAAAPQGQLGLGAAYSA